MARSKQEQESTPVTEVAVPVPFSRKELSSIHSFEDALRLAADTYGGVVAAHEAEDLGDGFRLATEEDKKRLVGVPLMLLDWTFREGDYTDQYVSIMAVAQMEGGVIGKYIINDGSTGIRVQLREYQDETGRTGGLMVRNGLRMSEYPVNMEDGETKGMPFKSKQEYRHHVAQGKKVGEARTFYLDTSA